MSAEDLQTHQHQQPQAQSQQLLNQSYQTPQSIHKDGDNFHNSTAPAMLSNTTKGGRTKNKEKKRKKKKKRPPHKSKMITGYIIYASEIRKEVIKRFPEKDFGYISKLVGVEWKNLPQEVKFAYEKRAQEQNAKSKAIAAEAMELKKLADAADEQAAKEQAASQSFTSNSLPVNCNGYAANGHSYPNNQHLLNSELSQSSLSPGSFQQQFQQGSQHMQHSTPMSKNNNIQQQPLQIIQQQQQTIATTVQYCNNSSNRTPCPDTDSIASQSQSSQQYQRNNIVYRKPATVRLRPKDGSTQTEPIKWVPNEPKKPLRFSQKFIDYLNSIHHRCL